jgi:hypothetical protein
MNREQILQTWRGAGHPWTLWVKLPLFEGVPEPHGDAAVEGHAYRGETPPWAALDTSWLRDRSAVILDLPGAHAVALALALGLRGLRPVLAINACSENGELISMAAVQDLLAEGARFPSAFPSGPALPAFILDARRAGDGREPPPGAFDNRWALFDADLPSASELRANGVVRAIVVQEGAEVHGDLASILRGYAREGLELLLHDPARGDVGRIKLERRGWLGELFGRLTRRSTYKRRWDGSFGRRVPIPPEPSHG